MEYIFIFFLIIFILGLVATGFSLFSEKKEKKYYEDHVDLDL